jgi:hypothetical protein
MAISILFPSSLGTFSFESCSNIIPITTFYCSYLLQSDSLPNVTWRFLAPGSLSPSHAMVQNDLVIQERILSVSLLLSLLICGPPMVAALCASTIHSEYLSLWLQLLQNLIFNHPRWLQPACPAPSLLSSICNTLNFTRPYGTFVPSSVTLLLSNCAVTVALVKDNSTPILCLPLQSWM